MDKSPSAWVRRSAELVSKGSTQIQINLQAVTKFASFLAPQVLSGSLGLDRWKSHELHPKSADNHAVDWIFVVDTLNFSFWSEVDDPISVSKFAVDYKGKRFTGYWSVCAAINRAIDEGIPILDPNFYANISDDQMKAIFRTSTEGEMPMLNERKKNLHEAGRVLIEKYNCSFVGCLQLAGNSAQKLVELILAEFPSYRDDECTYQGEKVAFYKRAQILVADIWACFEGAPPASFTDIDSLTMFADYRIPQALTFFGILTYGADLQKKLMSNYIFQYGEKEEVEFRGCSIWAVELVIEELNRMLGKESPKPKGHINAVILDHYLWDYRQEHNRDMLDIPYHKVRCIYY